MYSTSVIGHVRASRSAVYQALLDPDAVAAWRVPDGMTATVHEFEAREGGSFRVSLTYDDAGEIGKSGGHTDTYRGRFTRLVPDEEVVEVSTFETSDPALATEMTMTTTLVDAGDGTDVTILHEGIPDDIPADANEAGTRMALANLAALLDPGTDDNQAASESAMAMSTRATIALPTADRRRAHAFYGAGLGFDTPGTPADDGVPEPLTVVVTEGCQLMMIPTGGFGWVTAGRTVAEPGTVECLLSLDRDTPAELDAFVERARAAGAEILAEPEDRPWGYSATFTDPDAHMWQVLVPTRE